MDHAFAVYDAVVHCFGDNALSNWHNRIVAVHSHIRIEYVEEHVFSVHNFVRKRCNEIGHRSDSHGSL